MLDQRESRHELEVLVDQTLVTQGCLGLARRSRQLRRQVPSSGQWGCRPNRPPPGNPPSATSHWAATASPYSSVAEGNSCCWSCGTRPRGRPRATHLRSGQGPSLRAPHPRRLPCGTRPAGGRGPPTFAQARGLRCARRIRGACLVGPGPRAAAGHPPSLRPGAFAARAASAALALWDPARGRPRATHLRSGQGPSLRAPHPRRLPCGTRPAGGRGPPTFAQARGLRCARRIRGACLVGPGARAVGGHPPSLRPGAFAARAASAALALWDPARERSGATHLRSGQGPSLRAPRSATLAGCLHPGGREAGYLLGRVWGASGGRGGGVLGGWSGRRGGPGGSGGRRR